MHNFKIGQNSLAVYKTIVQNHPKIEFIKLIAHKVSINWRQLYTNNDEKMKRIKSAMLHQKPIYIKVLKREQFLKLELSELKKLKSNTVWSISSKVICTNGKQYYIPMMNFHQNKKNISDIKVLMKIVCKKYKGAILDSGRYFHYYGDALLTEKEWLKFLSDFLMPCIFVNPRYIGHSIYRGYCTLRLTSDRKYKTTIPKVIEIVNF